MKSNREKRLAMIAAIDEGAEVQVQYKQDGIWLDMSDEAVGALRVFDLLNMNPKEKEFRLKPEEYLRPFNTNEAINAIGKLIYRKEKEGKEMSMIIAVEEQGHDIPLLCMHNGFITATTLLDSYLFKGAEPCGIWVTGHHAGLESIESLSQLKERMNAAAKKEQEKNLSQKFDQETIDIEIGMKIFQEQINKGTPLEKALEQIMLIHKGKYYTDSWNLVTYIMKRYPIKNKVWEMMLKRPNIIVEKFKVPLDEAQAVIDGWRNEEERKDEKEEDEK